ncbi:MAG: hypothetical protein R8J85_08445 [Mariprofundales bacterium]
MQHHCARTQQQLKQAVLRKQWDKAFDIINKYDHCIGAIQQNPDSVSPATLRQYESENRRLVQQLRLAMEQASDEIDDLTRTINRLERSKAMIVDHTPKT